MDLLILHLHLFFGVLRRRQDEFFGVLKKKNYELKQRNVFELRTIRLYSGSVEPHDLIPRNATIKRTKSMRSRTPIPHPRTKATALLTSSSVRLIPLYSGEGHVPSFPRCQRHQCPVQPTVERLMMITMIYRNAFEIDEVMSRSTCTNKRHGESMDHLASLCELRRVWAM